MRQETSLPHDRFLSLLFVYTRSGVHLEHVGNHFDSVRGWLPVLNIDRLPSPVSSFEITCDIKQKGAGCMCAVKNRAVCVDGSTAKTVDPVHQKLPDLVGRPAEEAVPH
jgi:hypothetical protein